MPANVRDRIKTEIIIEPCVPTGLLLILIQGGAETLFALRAKKLRERKWQIANMRSFY